MTPRIAIIGSGPTGIYTLRGLIAAERPLSVVVFERETDPGKGSPYHPHVNDQAMLANIASFELPPICETLVAWLRRQPDEALQRLSISRDRIDDREFYPRVVLGEFLQSQFEQLVARGRQKGHAIDVRPLHRVVDIKLRARDIQLDVSLPDGAAKHYAFDHVVMATGHDWPQNTEIKPGYFVSPWPAAPLKERAAGAVGILGTSLSAIDALITVSTAHGAFYRDPTGALQYQGAPGSEAFTATLMSRKGLLPEADFYFDYPHAPLQICTEAAMDALIARKSARLLDEMFELFRRELAACDPDYAAKIGLSLLTVDTFASAYFAARQNSDPFVWAASNLAEAEQNKINRHTVPWRDAILRMHEVLARAIPHLDKEDLARFHGSFKAVFVDDYATVPHESIRRLLALRRAGKLEILALGADYAVRTENVARGAMVQSEETTRRFDAFIDATGQRAMSADDLPFPSLVAQGIVKPAATRAGDGIITGETEDTFARTGGVDLDAAFRPIFPDNLCNNLYCAAISFLLHKMPFVQGITSARDIGEIVSSAIRDAVETSPQLVSDAGGILQSTNSGSPGLIVPVLPTAQ
jgi:uncharacterized NAD(P)/FAD-binding protein YdhS